MCLKSLVLSLFLPVDLLVGKLQVLAAADRRGRLSSGPRKQAGPVAQADSENVLRVRTSNHV